MSAPFPNSSSDFALTIRVSAFRPQDLPGKPCAPPPHTPVATRSTEPYVPKLNGFLDRKIGRHLTARELDIATRLTRGSSDKEIGKQLKITWGTVHNHRKSIYTKLGVHSVPQMIHKLQSLDKKA